MRLSVAVLCLGLMTCRGACSKTEPPEVRAPPSPETPSCCAGPLVTDFVGELERPQLQPPAGWGVCRFCRRDCSIALGWIGVVNVVPLHPATKTVIDDGESTIEDLMTFDARGLPVEHRTVWPMKETLRTYQFSDAGQLLSETLQETDADNEVWHEAFSYVTTPVDGGSRLDVFRSFDDAGWKLDRSETTYESEHSSVTVAGDETSRVDFDDAGRIVAATDKHGRLRYRYDAQGRLESTSIDGTVTRYEYDDAGSRVASRQGSNRQTWTLTSDGLPSKHDDATFSIVSEYQYDERRRLIEVRKAAGTFSPRTTKFQYDDARVTEWERSAPWCVRVHETGRAR